MHSMLTFRSFSQPLLLAMLPCRCVVAGCFLCLYLENREHDCVECGPCMGEPMHVPIPA